MIGRLLLVLVGMVSVYIIIAAHNGGPSGTRLAAAENVHLDGSWYRGSHGTAAFVEGSITNANDFAIRDPIITCRLVGQSGSEIAMIDRTLYERFEPKETRALTNFALGTISDLAQVRSASCWIAVAQPL